MIKQFIFNVEWGELDYLIIDTPPGTSDEHIAIAEYLTPFKPQAIIVTTPQLVALADVERELGFCRQLGIPVLGIIENMSGYLCPHCAECTNIFSKEGGRLLAEKYDLPFLGRIPISPQFTKLVEDLQANLLSDYPTRVPELYALFKDITTRLNLV
jgi:Mrp family chromosome partitioning ATPase